MRLIRVGIGITVVAILFAIFAMTSRPREDLRSLRPYITSETDEYRTEQLDNGKERIEFARTMVVHDLTLPEFQRILKTESRGESGFWSMGLGKIAGKPAVFQVQYWHGLSWNEILWLRMTRAKGFQY
jgi:hypothetical protein